MRHSSLLSLPVIALFLSSAVAEPNYYGTAANNFAQDANYQTSVEVQPLPPVGEPVYQTNQMVEPIAATLGPSDYGDTTLLMSFDADPLMTPGASTFDPLGPEMAAFIQKNAWKKGNFTITPYGYLQADVIYETNPSTRTDYALYVNPQLHGDREQFAIDAKSSRLGAIVGGPQTRFLGQCFRTAGTVEFDFQGQFQYYNRPGVLLRRAFIEMENGQWRFLAGQEWDVISPLNPSTLNYGVAFYAGNLDYRRPQVRVERTLTHSDCFLTKLQFSVNHSIAVDGDLSATDAIVDYNSKWPILEGRVGWTIGQRTGSCAKPVTIGLSGHIGQENYDFLFNPAIQPPQYNVDRITWSGNIDATVPVTQKLRFLGEFFIGENLSQFFGGIGQGINPATGETIRSIGGWAEAEYRWTSRLRSNLGYSIDDPLNQDLAADQRSFNQSIYLNAIYTLTKDFELGMEVSQWKTGYIGDATYDLARLQWMARYKF